MPFETSYFMTGVGNSSTMSRHTILVHAAEGTGVKVFVCVCVCVCDWTTNDIELRGHPLYLQTLQVSCCSSKF